MDTGLGSFVLLWILWLHCPVPDLQSQCFLDIFGVFNIIADDVKQYTLKRSRGAVAMSELRLHFTTPYSMYCFEFTTE